MSQDINYIFLFNDSLQNLQSQKSIGDTVPQITTKNECKSWIFYILPIYFNPQTLPDIQFCAAIKCCKF